MEKGVQTLFATVLGAVLLLVGLAGFFTEGVLLLFSVNGVHNIVHLLSGVIGLWAGVWGGAQAAQWFNRIFGSVYALVAVLGLAGVGFVVTLLNLNAADNWLHVVIALASLGVGFFAKQ